MKGPAEEPKVAPSPVRGKIKSVDLARTIELKLGIEGKVIIKQIRGGKISFSIETKDYEKLLALFHEIPSFLDGDENYIKEVRETDHGKYTVVVTESHFRLRLLAHLYLRIAEERKAVIDIANLIDRLRTIEVNPSNVDKIRAVFGDYKWDPSHFIILHEESFLCSHVRKLVQAHTLMCLADPNEKFLPKKAAFVRIDNLKAKHKGELNCVIEVVPQDCLEAARPLVKLGLPVCVLNMANQNHVGGGYAHGAGAQEEDLCRRTDLLNSLPDFYEGAGGFGDFTVLYSEGVTVFRKGADAGYEVCKPDDRFQVNMVSSAAYNLGNEKSTSYKDPNTQQYEDGMKRKIRGQLRAAKANHDRALVLSAFGCGAFGNDSKRVAQFYLDVISEQEFANAFDYIKFAIIPNPSQDNNDNFTNFQRVFQGKGLRPEDLVLEVVEETLEM
ncbi:MAG: TIGR02452 family protein [Gammaproteobacteria bacterium]|nr:TIGR02452 family protein [Gammaproteobacteria bacterium]